MASNEFASDRNDIDSRLRNNYSSTNDWHGAAGRSCCGDRAVFNLELETPSLIVKIL